MRRAEIIPFLISLISIILSLTLYYRVVTRPQTRVEMGYNFITNFYAEDIEYREFLQNKTKNITEKCVFDKCKVNKILEWLWENRDTIKDVDDDGKKNCKDFSYTFMILSKIHGVYSWYCYTKNHILLLSKIDDDYMIVDPSNTVIFDDELISKGIVLKDYLVCDLR